MLDVIRYDTSLLVRRHVARGMSEAILFSLAMNDISSGTPSSGFIDANSEIEQSPEQRTEARNTAIVKTLRKEFGKRRELRQILEEALL
jgi:transcription initiation factor TFIID subunit 2